MCEQSLLENSRPAYGSLSSIVAATAVLFLLAAPDSSAQPVPLDQFRVDVEGTTIQAASRPEKRRLSEV